MERDREEVLAISDGGPRVQSRDAYGEKGKQLEGNMGSSAAARPRSRLDGSGGGSRAPRLKKEAQMISDGKLSQKLTSWLASLRRGTASDERTWLCRGPLATDAHYVARLVSHEGSCVRHLRDRIARDLLDEIWAMGCVSDVAVWGASLCRRDAARLIEEAVAQGVLVRVPASRSR